MSVVEVIEFRPIVVWRYNLKNDFCQICRNPMTGSCNSCKSNCKIFIGDCGHEFHNHCIINIPDESSISCPLCKTMWKTKKSIDL